MCVKRAERAHRRAAALLESMLRENSSPDALGRAPLRDTPELPQAFGDNAVPDSFDQMEDDLGPTTQVLRLPFGAPPRVLLVDDDELVLARLQDLVAAAGFEVDTALGGASALAALQRNFSPVVIMDLQMPDMDGLALCRSIRNGTWPDVYKRQASGTRPPR